MAPEPARPRICAVSDSQGQDDEVRWDPVDSRRRFIADRWWFAAGPLAAIGGGALLPLNQAWASALGGLLVAASLVVIALGLVSGPRGRDE